MSRLKARITRIDIVVALLIAVAYFLRLGSKNLSDGFFILSLVRTAIYLCLFTAWGVSLRHRIIQTQVRRYLISVAALIIVWLSLRTAKYFFVSDPTFVRLLWYGFYFPMLFIPVLAVFVSMSLGKPENYRLPKQTALLFVPSIAFFILVLTNDIHYLVFTFSCTVDDYGYGRAYFFIMLWILACTLASFATMAVKCRVPHSKSFVLLPLLPICMSIAYCVVYAYESVYGEGPLLYYLGDLTVFQGVAIMAIFEACIRCGLIQSNTRYQELISISTSGVQITDEALNIRYASKSAQIVDRDTLSSAIDSPNIMSNGVRLSASEISGGYSFWQEDISALLNVLQSLEVTNRELQSFNNLLEQENRQKILSKKVKEQNRLYDELQNTISSHVQLLSALTHELQFEDNVAAARKELGKTVVIGSFIKRRCNLFFIAGQGTHVSTVELELCLQESVAYLRLYGVTSAYNVGFEGEMPCAVLTELYEYYSAVVEQSLDSLSYCYASFEMTEEGYCANIVMQCDGQQHSMSDKFPRATTERDEDGLLYCFYTVSKGNGEKQ